jgi:hypothetical protein
MHFKLFELLVELIVFAFKVLLHPCRQSLFSLAGKPKLFADGTQIFLIQPLFWILKCEELP